MAASAVGDRDTLNLTRSLHCKPCIIGSLMSLLVLFRPMLIYFAGTQMTVMCVLIYCSCQIPAKYFHLTSSLLHIPLGSSMRNPKSLPEPPDYVCAWIVYDGGRTRCDDGLDPSIFMCVKYLTKPYSRKTWKTESYHSRSSGRWA